ncbi:MAG: hypothetical protein ABIA74_01640 [bacterium]
MKKTIFLSLFLVGIMANLNARIINTRTIKVSELLKKDLPIDISGQVIIQNDITQDIQVYYKTPKSWDTIEITANNSQQLGNNESDLKLIYVHAIFKVSNLLNKTMPIVLKELGRSIRVKNDTMQDVVLGYKWIGYEKETKIGINQGSNWGTNNISEISSIKKIETPQQNSAKVNNANAKEKEMKQVYKEKIEDDSELLNIKAKIDAIEKEKERVYKEKFKNNSELLNLKAKIDAIDKERNRVYKEKIFGDLELQNLNAKINAKEKEWEQIYKKLQKMIIQNKMEQDKAKQDSLKKQYYDPLEKELQALHEQMRAKQDSIKKQYFDPLEKELQTLHEQFRDKGDSLKKQYFDPLEKEYRTLHEQMRAKQDSLNKN